jgi:hypothetical protein
MENRGESAVDASDDLLCKFSVCHVWVILSERVAGRKITEKGTKKPSAKPDNWCRGLMSERGFRVSGKDASDI